MEAMHIHMPSSVSALFAFVFLEEGQDQAEGWKVYANPLEEYKRLGLPNEYWKLVDMNTEYKYIPTYPGVFLIPQEFPDRELVHVMSFRKSGRIPVCTWKHPSNNAVIARCVLSPQSLFLL